MDESLRQLWHAFMWYAGLSATITVGLFGWLARIQRSLPIHATLDDQVKKILQDVEEIKVALKGDYEKKGLVTRHYDLEKRVGHLESSRP